MGRQSEKKEPNKPFIRLGVVLIVIALLFGLSMLANEMGLIDIYGPPTAGASAGSAQ